MPCPTCGKHNFTDIQTVQPDVQDIPGSYRGCEEYRIFYDRRQHRVFSLTLRTCREHPERRFRLVSDRSVSPSGNEITPGNFTFRTREFEQMELEFFCEPDTDLEWFAYWKDFCINWLQTLGIKPEEMRVRDHDKEELSFYSKATSDIEFSVPIWLGRALGYCRPYQLRSEPPCGDLR